MASLHNARQTLQTLGPVEAVRYWKQRSAYEMHPAENVDGAAGVFMLRLRDLQYPVHGRAGTSDIRVFSQIFLDKEYACLADAGEVRYILDCGANVGYSTVFFLNRFPEARVAAVEPDAGNFAVLSKNIAPYDNRADAVCAGVWSCSTDLVVSRASGDGQPWSFTVKEAAPGEKADVKALDIPTLMKRFEMPRLDILKVDIEGSEREVFARGTEGWLDKVGILVMEIHGDDCRSVVDKALASVRHRVYEYHELTVFETEASRSRSAE